MVQKNLPWSSKFLVGLVVASVGGALAFGIGSNLLFPTDSTNNTNNNPENTSQKTSSDVTSESRSPSKRNRDDTDKQHDEQNDDANSFSSSQSGQSSQSNQSNQSGRLVSSNIRTFTSWFSTQPLASHNHKTSDNSSQPTTPALPQVEYIVRAVDENGAEISRVAKQGKDGASINVKAEDLFNKGYELLDNESKTIKLDRNNNNEVAFQYGKARELMSLNEFTSREVDYKHPLVYRNIDFTNDQERLEDFVVKKIYQGDRTTGTFYGTKDQASLIRTSMLNGSVQGGYYRYATNVRDMPPQHVEGDKYALEIEFDYMEDLDYIKDGEKKVTEFYDKYGKLNLSDIEKAKLIQDWLIENVKLFYPPQQSQEWFKNSKGIRRVHFPASALLDGEGVCLTYATTFARLAERLGLDVRVVLGHSGMSSREDDPWALAQIEAANTMYQNPDTTTYRPELILHAWNLVKIDNAWHHADVFHDISLMQNFKLDNAYTFFLNSDEEISSHAVSYEMPSGTRTYYFKKAWHKRRISPAPTSRNQEAKTLPNLVTGE